MKFMEYWLYVFRKFFIDYLFFLAKNNLYALFMDREGNS